MWSLRLFLLRESMIGPDCAWEYICKEPTFIVQPQQDPQLGAGGVVVLDDTSPTHHPSGVHLITKISLCFGYFIHTHPNT